MADDFAESSHNEIDVDLSVHESNVVETSENIQIYMVDIQDSPKVVSKKGRQASKFKSATLLIMVFVSILAMLSLRLIKTHREYFSPPNSITNLSEDTSDYAGAPTNSDLLVDQSTDEEPKSEPDLEVSDSNPIPKDDTVQQMDNEPEYEPEIEEETENESENETDVKFDYYKNGSNPEFIYPYFQYPVLNISNILIKTDTAEGADPSSHIWSINCEQFVEPSPSPDERSFEIDLKYKYDGNMCETKFKVLGDVSFSPYCHDVLPVKVKKVKKIKGNQDASLNISFKPVKLGAQVIGHYQIIQVNQNMRVSEEYSERLCERFGGTLADLELDYFKPKNLDELSKSGIDKVWGKNVRFEGDMIGDLFGAPQPGATVYDIVNRSPDFDETSVQEGNEPRTHNRQYHVLCQFKYADSTIDFSKLNFAQLGHLLYTSAQNRQYQVISTILKVNPFITHNGNTILHLAVQWNDFELFSMIPKNIYFLHFKNKDRKMAISYIKSLDFGRLLTDRLVLELTLFTQDKNSINGEGESFMNVLTSDVDKLTKSFYKCITTLLFYITAGQRQVYKFRQIFKIIRKDSAFDNLKIDSQFITTNEDELLKVDVLVNVGFLKYFMPFSTSRMRSSFYARSDIAKEHIPFMYKCTLLRFEEENFDAANGFDQYTDHLLFFSIESKKFGLMEISADAKMRLKSFNVDLKAKFIQAIKRRNYDLLEVILSIDPLVNFEGKTILHYAIINNDENLLKLAPENIPLLHILDNDNKCCFEYINRDNHLSSSFKTRYELECHTYTCGIPELSPYHQEVHLQYWFAKNYKCFNPDSLSTPELDDFILTKNVHLVLHITRDYSVLKDSYLTFTNYPDENWYTMIEEIDIFIEDKKVSTENWLKLLIESFFKVYSDGNVSDFTVPLFEIVNKKGEYAPNSKYESEIYTFAGTILHVALFLNIKFEPRFIDPIYRLFLLIEPARPETIDPELGILHRKLLDLNIEFPMKQEIEKLTLEYSRSIFHNIYSESIKSFVQGYGKLSLTYDYTTCHYNHPALKARLHSTSNATGDYNDD